MGTSSKVNSRINGARSIKPSSPTDNSPAGAVQAVKSVLERKGITTTGLDMRNCSGLTEDSKLTARTLLEVQLRNLAAGSGAAAAEGMSVMGFVGTAESRLNDADEAGLIRVKTGSLGDVTSMTPSITSCLPRRRRAA